MPLPPKTTRNPTRRGWCDPQRIYYGRLPVAIAPLQIKPPPYNRFFISAINNHFPRRMRQNVESGRAAIAARPVIFMPLPADFWRQGDNYKVPLAMLSGFHYMYNIYILFFTFLPAEQPISYLSNAHNSRKTCRRYAQQNRYYPQPRRASNSRHLFLP